MHSGLSFTSQVRVPRTFSELDWQGNPIALVHCPVDDLVPLARAALAPALPPSQLLLNMTSSVLWTDSDPEPISLRKLGFKQDKRFNKYMGVWRSFFKGFSSIKWLLVIISKTTICKQMSGNIQTVLYAIWHNAPVWKFLSIRHDKEIKVRDEIGCPAVEVWPGQPLPWKKRAKEKKERIP